MIAPLSKVIRFNMHAWRGECNGQCTFSVAYSSDNITNILLLILVTFLQDQVYLLLHSRYIDYDYECCSRYMSAPRCFDSIN